MNDLEYITRLLYLSHHWFMVAANLYGCRHLHTQHGDLAAEFCVKCGETESIFDLCNELGEKYK